MSKIILASSSPRRKMLLEQLGLEFEVITSDIEEKVESGLSPEEVVKSLAYQKAKSVANGLTGDYLVIGSDTIVALDNEILGKPIDYNDAYRMLKNLSGKTHEVMTGVCIINTTDKTYLVDCDVSHVKFRNIEYEEIKAYVKSGEPLDKAGAYGIQGLASVFIEKIEGSYTGIVGLPVFTVDKLLRHFGVNVLGER